MIGGVVNYPSIGRLSVTSQLCGHDELKFVLCGYIEVKRMDVTPHLGTAVYTGC